MPFFPLARILSPLIALFFAVLLLLLLPALPSGRAAIAEISSVSAADNPPALDAISPASGSTSGGVLLTLLGSNLGIAAAQVTVGDRSCQIEQQTASRIVCRLPAGQGANLPVLVTVGGQTSNALSFSYNPPVLNNLWPAVAPTSGGATLVLSGSNFGTDSALIMVTVGGQLCPLVELNHTNARCQLPAGRGADLPVTLSVAGQTSNVLNFSYGSPRLVNVFPASGPANQAITLTLIGDSFAADAATVRAGDFNCAVQTQNHTSIQCLLEPGSGGTVPLVVTVDGRASNALSFTFDDSENSCQPGRYLPPGQQECVPAPPGSFVAVAGATAPTQCPAGSYQAQSGATSCLSTSPGSFAPLGATAATPCEVGSYQPAAGAASCLPAEPGYFVAAQGQLAQVACDEGRYQPVAGAASCLEAPAGTFVDKTGSSAAQPCELGSYQPEPGATSCLLAQPGRFVAEAGATAATLCEPGRYQPAAGAALCLPAEPGYFVAAQGQLAQVACDEGRYQPVAGAASCLEAPAGTFVDKTGSSAAQPCEPGSYQPEPGATSCLLAQPGRFVAEAGATAATLCEPGRYQPAAGAASCLPAPVGTFVANSGATAAEFCPSGTTSRSPGAVRCEPLPEDAAPNGGDGNNDGIPDRFQDNVTSFVPISPESAYPEAGYWTLEAPPDSVVTGVYTRTDLPDFSFDASLLPVLVGFAIEDLTPGEAISTTLYFEEDVQPVSYFKYGPTPDRPEPHWYEFLYDGRTGARIAGNTVTLYFVDGERGDSDLTANGVIVDPGVPAINSSSGCLFGANGLQCTMHLPLVRSP